MLLDELQRTWQSQPGAKVRVDAAVLLQQLRRSQRDFKITIFWRDFREVIVAAVMAVWFAWDGFSGDGWPWVLLGATCVWVGGFILVDRFRRRGRAARFGDSLLGCVEASLEDVEHQIWLLRNVFWWYLLPPGIAMAVAFIHMGLKMNTEPSWLGWLLMAPVSIVCVAVFAFVYWLNQYAVRKNLEPRRQELLAVRESLLRDGE
jgi:hypothetical protein